MKQITQNQTPILGLRDLAQSYSQIDPTQVYDLTSLKDRTHDPKLVDQFQSAIRAVRRKLASS